MLLAHLLSGNYYHRAECYSDPACVCLKENCAYDG